MAVFVGASTSLFATQLLQNNSFDQGSNHWITVSPEMFATPGEVQFAPFISAPSIHQDLDTADVANATVQASVTLQRGMSPTGNSMAVHLSYTTSSGTTNRMLLAQPDNDSLPFNTPVLVSTNFTLPADAQRIVSFEVDLEGNGFFLLLEASLDVTVNGGAAPDLAIVQPINGALFLPGANLILRAAVTANGATVTGVDFYANGALLGPGQPDVHGEWAFPDGAHLSVMEGEPEMIDYVPGTGGMFFLSGAYSTPTRFAGMFGDTSGNMGHVTVDFSFTPDGHLRALLQGDAPLGTVTLDNGLQEAVEPGYAFHWPGVSVGAYALTAVANYGSSQSVTSAPVQVTVVTGKPHGSDYVKNLTQTVAHDTRWQDQENQLAVSGSSVHVAWHASTTGTNNITTNRIYYARSLDQGVTFQPWVLLEEFTESGYNFGRRWLAVDGQDVHLVTVSQGYLDGGGGHHGQVLRHHRSTDGGATFQPAQVLGTTASDEGFGVALIAASQGNVSLALDFGKVSHPTSLKFLYSTNGGVSFSGDILYQTWTPIWLSQLTQSGSTVVLAWENSHFAGFWHDGVPQVACSTNAGASFTITSLADVPVLYAANHSDLPRTAFAETNVLAVFIVENTNATPQRSELRLRRSTDSGVTFGPPVNLAPTLVNPAVEVPADDQYDLALDGPNVCVVFATTGYQLYVARSTNGGATFLPPQLLANAAFNQGAPMILQPHLAQHPQQPSQLHLFWSGCWYARSTDGGATWTPPVNLMLQYSGWLLLPTPQVTVDSSGALHWNVTGFWHASDYDDFDLLYRRFRHAAPPAGALNLAAQFVQDHDNFSFLRYDNLQIAAVPSLQFSNAFSVETWVKLSAKSLADSAVTVLSQKASNASEYDPYRLFMSGDYPGSNHWFAAEIGMTGGVASRVLTAPAVLIRPDVWYHLALTFDAGGGQPNLNLYVNGALQDSAHGAFPLATSTGLVHLAMSENANDFLTGALDDLRFWNRALTAPEIRDRFTGPLTGSEPGLAAYYTFDGTWGDSTGNGLPAVPMYRESFIPGRVNPNALQVTGGLTLEAFVGSSRLVTFKASDASGAVLRTWESPLNFAEGTAAYVLSDVPASTAHLSAKTEWHLRKRLPAQFANSTATVNFTVAAALAGGALNNASQVDLAAYSWLAAAWYQPDSVADIDGSGVVDLDDYFLLSNHWLQVDDAP